MMLVRSVVAVGRHVVAARSRVACRSTARCLSESAATTAKVAASSVSVSCVGRPGLQSYDVVESPPNQTAEEKVVFGVVSGFQQQLSDAFRASSPPADILEQLQVSVTGEMESRSSTTGDGNGIAVNRIRAKHILVDSEEMCRDILAMADAGKESFSLLARRHSRYALLPCSCSYCVMVGCVEANFIHLG